MVFVSLNISSIILLAFSTLLITVTLIITLLFLPSFGFWMISKTPFSLAIKSNDNAKSSGLWSSISKEISEITSFWVFLITALLGLKIKTLNTFGIIFKSLFPIPMPCL